MRITRELHNTRHHKAEDPFPLYLECYLQNRFPFKPVVFKTMASSCVFSAHLGYPLFKSPWWRHPFYGGSCNHCCCSPHTDSHDSFSRISPVHTASPHWSVNFQCFSVKKSGVELRAEQHPYTEVGRALSSARGRADRSHGPKNVGRVTFKSNRSSFTSVDHQKASSHVISTSKPFEALLFLLLSSGSLGICPLLRPGSFRRRQVQQPVLGGGPRQHTVQ